MQKRGKDAQTKTSQEHFNYSGGSEQQITTVAVDLKWTDTGADTTVVQ